MPVHDVVFYRRRRKGERTVVGAEVDLGPGNQWHIEVAARDARKILRKEILSLVGNRFRVRFSKGLKNRILE